MSDRRPVKVRVKMDRAWWQAFRNRALADQIERMRADRPPPVDIPSTNPVGFAVTSPSHLADTGRFRASEGEVT